MPFFRIISSLAFVAYFSAIDATHAANKYGWPDDPKKWCRWQKHKDSFFPNYHAYARICDPIFDGILKNADVPDSFVSLYNSEKQKFHSIHNKWYSRNIEVYQSQVPPPLPTRANTSTANNCISSTSANSIRNWCEMREARCRKHPSVCIGLFRNPCRPFNNSNNLSHQDIEAFRNYRREYAAGYSGYKKCCKPTYDFNVPPELVCDAAAPTISPTPTRKAEAPPPPEKPRNKCSTFSNDGKTCFDSMHDALDDREARNIPRDVLEKSKRAFDATKISLRITKFLTSFSIPFGNFYVDMFEAASLPSRTMANDVAQLVDKNSGMNRNERNKCFAIKQDYWHSLNKKEFCQSRINTIPDKCIISRGILLKLSCERKINR